MVAVLALAFAVDVASALRSLSLSGTTTLTLNGRVRFASEFATIECNVTILRTISRVIPKVVGILVGKIIAVHVPVTLPEPNCRSSVGRLTNIEIRGLEREEIARLFLVSFLGTLPRITGLLITVQRFQASFTTEISGRCGYESPAGGVGVLAAIDGASNLGNATFLANRAVRREGGIFCPRTGELSGTLIPLQVTNVRLI